MIVNPGQPVSFVYPTYDEATGLYVAANIYDVTTGTPVFLTQTAMSDIGSNGIYAGEFTPVSDTSYLVIMGVYLDAGFTTIDTTRSPGAENYDAFTVDAMLLNFNYGAYDQDASLTVHATIYNLTDSINAVVTMTHVLIGVYFGQYQGSLAKTYLVTKVPTDTSRPPGADNFQAYIFSGTAVNNFFEATLVGQRTIASSFSEENVIVFTQGDNAVLQLTATDGAGEPINLDGATFSTQIKSANGSTVAVFGNSQHAIVGNPLDGTFSLTLSAANTQACGEGGDKEILTKITIGGQVVYFHGFNMLTVYPATPVQ